MTRFLVAGLALTVAAGCSGGAVSAPAADKKTPPPTVTASPTPPALLTAQQAGVAYLQAVKASNTAETALNTELRRTPPRLPAVRSAATAYAKALRNFSLFLAQTPWPAAAARDAAALRVSVSKEIAVARDLSVVDSSSALSSVVDDYIAASKASAGPVDLMRQDIGLPSAT